MTATASIMTTEKVWRKDGMLVRGDFTTKEYENYYWAKEALDESLYLYLATLSGQEYNLEATQYGFKLQTADGRDATRTRSLELQIVLHV